jgi:hypothetical protein
MSCRLLKWRMRGMFAPTTRQSSKVSAMVHPQPTGSSTASFSCCDAAVTAAWWGWLALLPFLAWAGWDYEQSIDGTLGFLIAGGRISAVLMMIATMLVLWPIALLIRNRPAWWRAGPMIALGTMAGTSVPLMIILIGYEPISPLNEPFFLAFLLCWCAVGMSSGLAASRYYRRTHFSITDAENAGSSSPEEG